jgi:hypothetical protein
MNNWRLRLERVAVILALWCGSAPAVGRAQSEVLTRPGDIAESIPLTAMPVNPGLDRFFLFVFASQSVPKVPRYTHTWAVMVYQRAGTVVDVSTISWMPADLQIKPLRFLVEPGVNESCRGVIQRILDESRERISVWGPYEAHPILYERFQAQKSFLESGALGYQCIDCVGEARIRRNAGNCVHALKPLHGFAWGDLLEQDGDAAGEFVARSLVRDGLAFPGPHESEWLMAGLGIQSLPLVRRTAATAPVAVAPYPMNR